MIRFSKYIYFYFIISLAVIVPGLFTLLTSGLKPSIDFDGGTLLELALPKTMDQSNLTYTAEESSLVISSIQLSGDSSYIIRTKEEDTGKIAMFISSLQNVASNSATVIRNETVGPVLGKELMSKAFTAAVFAVFIILGYVAYAFRSLKFGMSAIIALAHDVLVVIGIFSLLGKYLDVEVDTLFVTAVLTTMSFSVHDTIVILDRIREYQRKTNIKSFEDIVDRALTETMGRSLVNSMTIIIMLTALVITGGETVKWFAVALLIGTISGTYSSPFVATPVLILWHRIQKRKS